MDKSNVLKNYFVERRRWLLGEVKYLDKKIEEWDEAEEMELPDPNKCQHIFLKGICKHCAIFEEVAKKHNVGIIKEADQPDK